ncbi:Glucoside xylosyltransferase 1 [Gossypium arboreum]|uniref:Glucoside xylosyltransferase 1 n=1 Tax=Gossypium arboreum TaxID=29729 RepID=A0A0B0P704_GOSAR|nr:Glucoside xylosyltransferase 1 [Gossypium arboreum]
MIIIHFHHKHTLKSSFHELIIISFKYIPVPYRNNFILITIFVILNEPLGIIMSDTREILHTRCHISINEPAHTNCQSRRSYSVLLTQAVKKLQHMTIYSAIGRTCRTSTRIT